MDYEVENNNYRTNANTYTLGNVMYGMISQSNDVDCYKVFLRPGHVKFNFIVPSGTNYRIRVFKGNGDIAIAETVDSATNRIDRSCDAYITAYNADDYYICISFNNVNPIFNANQYYSLNVYYTHLTLPNYNQKYTANDACIINGGCTICCVADIATYYKNAKVTLDNLKTAHVYYEGNARCHWDNIDSFTITDAGADSLYTTIKSEIHQGRPVLLHYNSIYSPNDGHWVVAYAYTGNCSSDSEVLICDPAFTYDTLNGTNDVYYSANTLLAAKEYNNSITITQAKNDSSISSLISIYKTSAKN